MKICSVPTKILTITINAENPFLSSANEVSTGLHVNFCLFVCLSVCVSSFFFKASKWMIYWLLTVVLATYLSDQVFRAWLSSATLRFFSLAEQCHTQKFYLRCFKSDFDAVKSKFGLLIEFVQFIQFVQFVQCFKADFDEVKSKLGLLS